MSRPNSTPAPYPLGIAISKAQLKSLPIEHHVEHGAWNYTVCPGGTRQPDKAHDTNGHAARRETLDLLAEPALTGMSREELTALAEKLAPELGALRAERLHRKRGGPRRHEAADGKRPLLSVVDRVLLSVLYLRHVCSQTIRAEMPGMNQRTLGPTIKEIRRPHHAHRPAVGEAGRPHRTPPPPASRRATTARHPWRCFRQKITDTERLLAAVLYERKIGTRQVLADAFGVSLSTLNNALADAQPGRLRFLHALSRHGHICHLMSLPARRSTVDRTVPSPAVPPARNGRVCAPAGGSPQTRPLDALGHPAPAG